MKERETHQENSKITALKQSIKHWETMAAFKTPQELMLAPSKDKPFSTSCALCDLFLAKNCVGCPVYEATGVESCVGTPYDDADAAFDKLQSYSDESLNDDDYVPEDWDDWQNAARKEVEFLKSLLPKGEK